MFYWEVLGYRSNKRLLGRFFLVWWLGHAAANAQTATPCVKIEGIIQNSANQPISARAFWRNDTGRNLLFQAGFNGHFEAEIPCEKGTISVEAKGYRTLTIPVGLLGKEPISGISFFIQLKLLPNDEQAANRPYQQSEQKHFTLKDTNHTSTIKPFAYHFNPLDALSGQSISTVSICLVYTKTGKRECIQKAPKSKTVKVVFREKDIVAFQVVAEGYQTYNGNLIIDDLNGQDRQYDVKLMRELTFLSVTVITKNEVGECWALGRNGDKIPMVKGVNKRFYANVAPNQLYKLVTDTKPESVNNQPLSVYAQPGLNTYLLKLQSPSDLTPLHVKEEIVDKIDTEQIIYFKQSLYELSPDSKQKLSQLAYWLKKHSAQTVIISGHTDNVGLPSLNQTLSEFRAKVVATYLIHCGVNNSQVIQKGYGSAQPKSINDSEENRQKNRRVELQIIENQSNILSEK